MSTALVPNPGFVARSMWRSKLTLVCLCHPFTREGEAFLIVYSVTSRASFDRVEKFRTQVARVKDSDAVPVVLVGNKIDRVHEREVETKHGEQLAQRLGCAFVETSAKTRENLEEAFFTAVRMGESLGQNALAFTAEDVRF
jgi:GTPase SAR1 family protein